MASASARWLKERRECFIVHPACVYSPAGISSSPLPHDRLKCDEPHESARAHSHKNKQKKRTGTLTPPQTVPTVLCHSAALGWLNNITFLSHLSVIISIRGQKCSAFLALSQFSTGNHDTFHYQCELCFSIKQIRMSLLCKLHIVFKLETEICILVNEYKSRFVLNHYRGQRSHSQRCWNFWLSLHCSILLPAVHRCPGAPQPNCGCSPCSLFLYSIAVCNHLHSAPNNDFLWPFLWKPLLSLPHPCPHHSPP